MPNNFEFGGFRQNANERDEQDNKRKYVYDSEKRAWIRVGGRPTGKVYKVELSDDEPSIQSEKVEAQEEESIDEACFELTKQYYDKLRERKQQRKIDEEERTL